MIQIKKTILTLVALLAVTTGAWADETLLLTIESKDYTSFKSGNMTFDDKVTVTFSNSVLNNGDTGGWFAITESLLTVAGTNGYTITSCKFYTNDGTANTGYTVKGESPSVYLAVGTVYTDNSQSVNIGYAGITKIEVYTAAASSGPEVDWNAAKNTGSFTMPGGNVTLEPEYYPQATVADGGVTAADADARATTDDPLVKVDATKLTGAKKLMYFVSNSGTAPAYDAEGWTDQLPTAEGFTQQGIVYVWYYPVGIDEGVDGATATYSDGDICLQSITARIAPEPTYAVTFAEGTDPNEWSASPAAGVKKGQTVTVTYSGTKKVIGVKAEKKGAPAEEPMTLGTPLTIEAITDGTIVVNIEGTLSTGMKYSVNGGTKTTITETTNIQGLKAGDKVQFYGNGTSTQVYGNSPNVKILGSGDGFQTKAYGNTMSLLDEEGFATKTDLPEATFVFSGLFSENTTLTDASELLLPATTLTVGCYYGMFNGCTSLTTAPKLPATTMATGCYRGMFEGCTSLTTAPKLPATTLAKSCYYTMFFNCTSLTSAYVKAAYTEENGECDYMFDLSKAAGAVLHTTPDNKASWETMMNKDWKNWTVADDWQD